MSDPFIAEIIMFGGNFAPRGWAHCDGQILPINQNSSLFSLLGTTYGGDGRTTFGLPDLRGRVPTHPGPLDGGGANPNALGDKGGQEAVGLTENQLPAPFRGIVTVEDSVVDDVAVFPAIGEHFVRNGVGVHCPNICERPDEPVEKGVASMTWPSLKH